MHNGFTDRYRRNIILNRAQVKNILPEHFKAAYPKFISLLEHYYEFLDEHDSTELIRHLFIIRDITETDITLLSYIEDELLLGEAYIEGFPDKRAAAKFSSQLFRSKGSKYSIEWFFLSFFGVEAEVFYPKENIFLLNQEESKIGPDYEKYLTDDKLYQTFALLVRSEIPISQWKEIFKLFVHPAGMYLGGSVLVQKLLDVDLNGNPVAAPSYVTPSFSFNSGSSDEGSSFTVVASQNNNTGGTYPGSTVDGTYIFYYVELNQAETSDFATPPPTDPVNLYPLFVSNDTGSVTFEFVDDADYAEGDEIFYVHFYDHENVNFARPLGTSTVTIGNVLPVYTVSLDVSSPITEIYSNASGATPTVITGSMTTSHPNGFSPAYASETVTLSFTGTGGSQLGRFTNLRWDDTGTTTTVMNATTKSFRVDFTGDDVWYGSPVIAIQAASAYASDTSDNLTVNDAPADYTIVPSSSNHTEGTSITFDVTVSNSDYVGSNLYWWLDNLTNMDASDFSGSPPIGEANRVQIPGAINANGNGGPNTVTITLAQDTLLETGESYRINISETASPGAFVDRTTITVVDDDTLTYEIQTFSDSGRTTAATTFTEGDTIYGRVVTNGSNSETVTVRFEATADIRIVGAANPNNITTFTNTAAGNYDFSFAIPSNDVYQTTSAFTIEATSVDYTDTHAVTINNAAGALVSVTGPSSVGDDNTVFAVDISPSNIGSYSFPAGVGTTTGTGSQSWGIFVDTGGGPAYVSLNSSIRFKTDFTIEGRGNSTPGNDQNTGFVSNGTWATGVTTQSSSNYYIRATLNSTDSVAGFTTSGTFGSWIQISSDQTWDLGVVNSSGSQSSQRSIKFEIADDAAGNNILDTFNAYWLGVEVDYSGGL